MAPVSTFSATTPRRMLRAFALVTAVAIAGCGSSASSGSDSQQITATIKGYLSALGHGDGQGTCGKLTSAAAAQVLQAAQSRAPQLGATSCADAIDKINKYLPKGTQTKLDQAKVENIKVTGTTATAHLVGGTAAAQLTKVNGHWLISGGIGSP